MSTPSDAFTDAAIGAVNALRLFAHNTRLEEASFESTLDETGMAPRQVIQFRSTQSWGDLVRTEESLTLAVSPIVGVAQNFVARRIVFPAAGFLGCRLFTATSDEMLSNDGRNYVIEFCDLIDVHQLAFQLLPFHFAGADHLLMSRAGRREDAEQSRDVDAIANAINTQLKREGLTIHIAHPAFDMPGRIMLIDRQDRVHEWPEPGPLRERLEQLETAVQKLPPALRFDLLDSEFPATYEVRPHAFTLELPQDQAAAKSRGIGAAMRAAVRYGNTDLLVKYHVTLQCPKPLVDPTTFAANLLIEDWCSAIGEARPEILDRKIEADTEDYVEVTLTLAAEPRAVVLYNEEGSFELRTL